MTAAVDDKIDQAFAAAATTITITFTVTISIPIVTDVTFRTGATPAIVVAACAHRL